MLLPLSLTLSALLFPMVMLAADWKLVFSDEFEGIGAPDPAKWRHEEGFVRNREPQWYARSLENACLQDGVLELTARRLPTPLPNPKFSADAPRGDWQRSRTHYAYTSGSIETKGLFSFRYGKVEVRARLPKGQGVWPAIWTLGTERRHPDCGEIDIMEYVWSSPQTVWATLHFLGREKMPTARRSRGHTGPEVADGQWHTYGLEWDEKRMVFAFDGKPYFTWVLDLANRPDGTNPFRAPHYLKLNLALGDPCNWGGKLEDGILPQTFSVDYVRVWQRTEGGSPHSEKKPAK